MKGLSIACLCDGQNEEDNEVIVRTGVTEAPAPLGGSQQVVYHMADLFKEAGGELHLPGEETDGRQKHTAGLHRRHAA